MREIVDEAGSWMEGGDFNSILHLTERRGRGYPKHHFMEELGQKIFDCSSIDVGFEGSQFTWTDKKNWQCLDPVLFSREWTNILPHTEVTHLPRSSSAHCPLLISLVDPTKCVSSAFRFMNMWLGHPELWLR